MNRRHRRWVGGVAAGLALAIAWASGLWLVVLGMFSAGTVLGREHILARRRLPTRLAALAMYAPSGPSPANSLERLIAADMAAVSRGNLDCLDRAQRAVEERGADPWRHGLATERRTIAHDLVISGCLVGVHARRDPPATRLRLLAGVSGIVVVLAVGFATQSQWWLLPLAVVSALFTVECVDFHQRRHAIPELLAATSLQDPVRRPFVLLEKDFVRSLKLLAHNDRSAIQRALRLLEGSGAMENEHARRRLLHAERLDRDSG